MTSRQPGTPPPGTMPPGTMPPGTMPPDRETAGARHRLASDPRWPVLVLPLTLLIIVGLAGLRGEVAGPQWDGPLHGDAVAVGIPLEIALVVVLHPARPWHTAVLGGALIAYLLVTHLAETEASPRALRPQVQVLALGAVLLALGAGAGMVPAASPGTASTLLRLVAAGALITAAVLVLPYVPRGETPDRGARPVREPVGRSVRGPGGT
jgi:hypothetical protein